MTTEANVHLVEAFVDMTEALSSFHDPIEFVQQVVERSIELLHVSDVGVLLKDADGRLKLTASSSGDMRVAELLEVHLDEGPCYAAFTRNVVIAEAELSRDDDRWPHFAPTAIDLGFRSVYAFPLRAEGTPIGAMNVFSEERSALIGQGLRIAQGLADFASLGIRLSDHLRQSELLTQQLQTALDSRVAIEQAKGMIAAQGEISLTAAFHLIRSAARNRGVRLQEIVSQVTSGALTAEDLAASDLDATPS